MSLSTSVRPRAAGALAYGRRSLGPSCLAIAVVVLAPGAAVSQVGPEPIVGPVNFLTGHPAVDAAGNLVVVIEIPAGTNAKWEVTHSGEALAQDVESGRPRVIRYLPYPVNYGMVPRTLVAHEAGGDGDPLDVAVLGAALERASVVSVRPIGILRLIDAGERDDKILAVPLEGPFGAVTALADLDRLFPGVTSIVETWFSSYEGPGATQSLGFEDRAAALATIEEAIDAFSVAHPPRD